MKNSVWGPRVLYGAIGAVLGIAVVAFFGFGSGMITTHAHLAAAVTEAKVAAYASVCADDAVGGWRKEKGDVTALRKVDAWDTREKLAQKYVVELHLASDKDLLDRVTRRCASDLMAVASETSVR